MSERRPEGVEGYTLDTGLFPFDAFTSTKPTASTPTLALKPEWKLSVGTLGATVADIVPAGTIFSFGGKAVPSGWLSCGGQAISRTTYTRLYTALSTTWGVGDGTTTFNVPDLRGVALRGAGTHGTRKMANTSTYYSGGAVGSATPDMMQGHRHAPLSPATNFGDVHATAVGTNFGAATPYTYASATTGDPATDTTNGTPRVGKETRMATSSVLYIIKT